MTIFIIKHLDGTQVLTRGQAIASDIDVIWEGEQLQFEALGFTEEQIGGFELVDNTLKFNQELFNKSQEQKKPLAMGKNLIVFIENAIYDSFPKNERGRLERMSLRNKLSVLCQDLHAKYLNPISKEEYKFIKSLIDNSRELSEDEKNQIRSISEKWASSVNFE